ncbi:MAG: flagellar basal-body rod protein FlgG [Magnetococcales bacterium]|nr:flagellar basal-body rod protein FlgG [Magnetococcales bacterium]
MIRALYTASTGMQAQQLNIDVIADNLANVNTTGFKNARTDFQDLLYANLRSPGAENSSAGTLVPVGTQLGHGVKVASVSKDFTQGSPVATSEDPMNVDMMVQGQGFFQIELPSGETAYTRDGSFKILDGNIVTSDGYPLIGGQIGFDPTTTLGISVESSGAIGLEDTSTTGFTSGVGQLQLARFVNPEGLNAIGNNLYKETESSGTPQLGNPEEDGYGSVNQHYLEQSNVSMVSEMVNMITTQRAYEVGAKAIQTADSMLGEVTGLKR